MSKMSTKLVRHALNGETMGTRWTALFHAPQHRDPAAIKQALQAAVAEVDAQMSTWRPDSDLMRLNAAPVNHWVTLPRHLMSVLATALQVGRVTDGAFEIALGDAVSAWGFGPEGADVARIKSAHAKRRRPSFECLDLDLAAGRARRLDDITLDLNGIAKGFGVDRLAETLLSQGISEGLVGIDGELRALGCQPNGTGWTVAVENPDRQSRAIHSILALQDAAVATSGDYRHWVTVDARSLSHTIDPQTGMPLMHSPASVTVVAPTCMLADAYATALMVMGAAKGQSFAARHRLSALFLRRDGTEIRSLGLGPVFAATG